MKKPNLPPSTVRAVLDFDDWCNLGDVDEALKAFGRLPDDIRDSPEALSRFTAFLFRMGRLKECFIYAGRATELYPTRVLFWIVASSCLKGPELREARRALLRKAAEKCPDDAVHLLAMAEDTNES